MKARQWVRAGLDAVLRPAKARYIQYRINQATNDIAFDTADLLTLPKRIKEHEAAVAIWRAQRALLQPPRAANLRKAIAAFCNTPPHPMHNGAPK